MCTACCWVLMGRNCLIVECFLLYRRTYFEREQLPSRLQLPIHPALFPPSCTKGDQFEALKEGCCGWLSLVILEACSSSHLYCEDPQSVMVLGVVVGLFRCLESRVCTQCACSRVGSFDFLRQVKTKASVDFFPNKWSTRSEVTLLLSFQR